MQIGQRGTTRPTKRKLQSPPCSRHYGQALGWLLRLSQFSNFNARLSIFIDGSGGEVLISQVEGRFDYISKDGKGKALYTLGSVNSVDASKYIQQSISL